MSRALLLATLVALAAPLGARATTQYAFSETELTYLADLVIEAEVEAVQVEREPGQRFLSTVTTLRLTHVIKGDAIEGDRILVRELGGVLGSERTDLAGAPIYVEGERVLVHLEMEEGPEPLWRTLGLSQGKRTLVREADTGRDVVLPLRNQRTTVRFDEAAVPLPAARIYASDVVERIRDLVETGAVPTYTTIPGLPAWKDARFRADAAADGQEIDPRFDALRARIFESEVER